MHGVVLAGKGMNNFQCRRHRPFGVWSNSRNTTIAHLTIRDTWDNDDYIQCWGESAADR